MGHSYRQHWALKFWDAWVIDPDFDVMFGGPIDLRFQEEPYQGAASKENQVLIRNAVVTKPAIGKHSVWPEQRRKAWKN
jgi:hypothetical protein